MEREQIRVSTGRAWRRGCSLFRWVAHRAPFGAAAAGLLLLAVAAALPAPVAFAASTITVNTTADENGTGGACSLREALTTANTNSNFGGCSGAAGGPFTINVPAGTYNLTAGELQVGTTSGANISISGAGAASTIIRQSAATCSSGTARVFDLDPSVVGNVAVSISGVTISNGAAQAFGGGAILGGGTNDSLTLSDSVISNNCTTGFFSAAGISWSPAGNVTISNTTFSNNVSGQAGGAILYTTSTGSTLTITNSTFSGNTAAGTGGVGGAIFIGGNGGSPTFSINGSVFTGNQATNASGIGGAIYIGGGTLNLGNTAANRFSGNSAGVSSSGGLGVRGGTANATNNWWGCNGGPGSGSGCDKADNSGGTLNFTPWVVLTNTASPTPIMVNQTTTLTADVLHNSSGGALTLSQVGVLLGRTVTWGNAVRGALSGAQATIQTNGTATATFTAAAAGAGSADATVDNATGTASISINKANTTTSISTDTPDPSVTGQPVTVNFGVTSSTGSTPTAPTGNVTVSDGTNSCTGSISSGTCNITFTSAGSKTLTATYAGDSNFNASPASAGVAHTVNRADTTTTITSDNPDPSVVGQSVTVQYTVSVNAPGGGTPTGNVTVSDGTVSCTGTVAAGQCSLTFTSAGAKSLSATYAGDANYNASPASASAAHTVNAADTTTTITSDAPDPSNVGQAVTVNYSVAVSSPGAGTPTGNVTVSDGVDSCTGTVGAGTCNVTLTTPGARTLTATYAGDSNFNGSTSAGEPHTVNSFATTTTIASDNPDPSVVGQSVMVTYAVAPAQGGGTPTGNVTVSDGTVSCTGTVAAGQCSLTFTSAGAKSLTATYAGDGTFTGSTSAAESHTVMRADTVTTITSDTPDPSAGGQGVTVHYAVAVSSPGAGTPTGNVTVSDGVNSCTGTVASGQCSIALTTNGARTLTATYAGDSNFNGSTSAIEPHTVDAIAPGVTINQAAGQADPTSSSPIHFTAIFTERVTGFTSTDVTLSGTAGATTAVVTEVAPNDGTTYDVAVSGMTTNGTVIASIPANAAADAVGNGSTASSSTDNTVTFIADGTPPDTTITAHPANPTSSTSASFSFTGSDDQTPPAALTFECSLDSGTFAACTSPKSYSGLSLGSHTFKVRAKDAAGNRDASPDSFTWEIHAATTLLYNGVQIVNVGTPFQPGAKLSSAVTACATSQQISFTLDRNPLSGAVGPYLLGTAITDGSGQATLGPAVATGVWLEGVYDLTASFAGTASCDASSDEATLTVASPGTAANGGGWYTLSGSGRVNFGFTVRKVDDRCTANCAYKGQLLLVNNGKWRLKGDLTAYSKTANGQGAASGTGDLYWWDATLNGGLGDWALAQSGVSYTISFYDSGKNGKASTDAFGVKIVYTPVSPQPSSLPNSAPQVLKGGDIRVS